MFQDALASGNPPRPCWGSLWFSTILVVRGSLPQIPKNFSDPSSSKVAYATDSSKQSLAREQHEKYCKTIIILIVVYSFVDNNCLFLIKNQLYLTPYYSRKKENNDTRSKIRWHVYGHGRRFCDVFSHGISVNAVLRFVKQLWTFVRFNNCGCLPAEPLSRPNEPHSYLS